VFPGTVVGLYPNSACTGETVKKQSSPCGHYTSIRRNGCLDLLVLYLRIRGVSDQLHTFPGNLEYRTMDSPRVCVPWEERKISCTCLDGTTTPRTSSRQPSHYADWAILAQFWSVFKIAWETQIGFIWLRKVSGGGLSRTTNEPSGSVEVGDFVCSFWTMTAVQCASSNNSEFSGGTTAASQSTSNTILYLPQI